VKIDAGFDMDKPAKKFNQRREIINYLKMQPGKAYSLHEIAQWLFDTFPKRCQEKKSKSLKIETDKQLLKQLAEEAGSFLYKSRLSQIKRTLEKPRKFFWQEITDSKKIETTAVESSDLFTRKISERDLYPLLSSYLHYELGLYPKRIDEKRSSNRRGSNGNKWLHPDMVSMEFLGKHWHPEVNACVDVYTRRYTRLWSFEVKFSLNSSNVRESFFQAVSNSSWANLGYLVAAGIKSEALQELRILSAAHGMGVIKLDINDVGNSQIIIPARERNEIDWDGVNRLVEENKDFEDYIKLIRHFYQTQRNIRPQDWDIPRPVVKQVNL